MLPGQRHRIAWPDHSTDVYLSTPWLTTERAQTELTQDILGKRRGSSVEPKSAMRYLRVAHACWQRSGRGCLTWELCGLL